MGGIRYSGCHSVEIVPFDYFLSIFIDGQKYSMTKQKSRTDAHIKMQMKNHRFLCNSMSRRKQATLIRIRWPESAQANKKPFPNCESRPGRSQHTIMLTESVSSSHLVCQHSLSMY